ncbi:MAG: hypothetical protein WAX33_04300 [Rectinemataceae bacterium]
MKRTSVISIFLLVAFFASAQQTLPGFWGLPWGTSSANIFASMLQKGYASKSADAAGIIYENVKFSGRDCAIAFFLNKNQLYGSSVRIYPPRNTAYETYQSLKSDLVEKYGTPTLSNEKYKPPYEKGDGHTEMAISMNYAEISSGWRFADGNVILLLVSNDDKTNNIKIEINYAEMNTFTEMSQKKKKAELDDL